MQFSSPTKFLRLILIPLIFGLPLLLSNAGVSAKDYRKLTMEQMNKLSKEEQKLVPIDVFFDLLGKEDLSKGRKNSNTKPVRTALLEFGLRRLGYYNSAPTGQDSDELSGAIKNFQKIIKSKPTGTLLMGELETLFNAMNMLEPPQISLPNKMIISIQEHGIISAEGTWKFQNGDQAFPLQTSKITCVKQTRNCQIVTANVSILNNSDDNGHLNIDVTDWAITRWTDTEVVAENDNPVCVSYTMTINFQKKEAFQFRRGKGGEQCKDFAEKPQILVLVDGFNVSWDYYKQRRIEGRKFMNPEYSNALKQSSSD